MSKFVHLFVLALSCLFFCFNNSVTAQTLYALKKTVNGSMTIPFDIVSINPFTGSSAILQSTNGLVAVAAGATAFDQQNRRFISWGFDSNNNQNLYVSDLDSVTTDIFNIPTIQPIEMEYDLQTQKAYGLWWDGTAEHFGEINLANGNVTSISTLPGVQAVAIGNSTFDSNTGTYMFIGVDASNYRLYSVKASTGTIVASPIIWQNGNRYSALEFNVNNDKLYGLFQNVDSSNYDSNNFLSYYTELQLAEINPITGLATVIDTNISVIEGYLPGYAVGGLCFDQQTETYIVRVQNENGTFLKLVDVSDASIIASTPISNTDYFYELQVDNYSFARPFYNLTASSSELNENIESLEIYPNPAKNYLHFKNHSELSNLKLVNHFGQIVLNIDSLASKAINIEKLPSGFYFLSAMYNNKPVRKTFVKY